MRPQYFYGSEWAQSFREVVPFGSIFVGDEMEIKRMRDLREDSDQTQKAIADVLNMHRSVYRRYESGQRETPAWVIVKLADYYRVSTDYLLGLTDNPEQPIRLSKTEKLMIKTLRTLFRDQQEAVHNQVQFFQKQNRRE